VVAGARHHRTVGVAGRRFEGEVFLDGDGEPEVRVGGQIGDAEPALAENIVDAEFLQPIALGQEMLAVVLHVALVRFAAGFRRNSAGFSRVYFGPWDHSGVGWEM